MSDRVQQVTRRRVFYIPGYDPIPPRRYRELYRKEGAAQSDISGYSLSLSPAQGENFGWSVEADMDGAQVQTRFEVLVWSDIVRESMEARILRTYAILARTAWTYISTGALFRLMKLRRGPVIAALYPIGVLLSQLLLALLVAHVTGWGAGLLHPLLYWGVGGAVLVGLLRWFKAIDGKIFAYYLMHDYGFSARWRGAEPPDLIARLDQFRAEIAAALHEDWDEVLVVGHSSGAHLAVSVLADLIRDGATSGAKPALSFLSLGQVVPMVAFLPEAKRLRRDLAYLSEREELFWLDVTAPGDPCSFALCDPVKVSGVATEAQRWPLVISAAFRETLSAEKQAEMKYRFFRRHFQYLCAFDDPQLYDYFQITAGPVTLRDRFAGCLPSPSRIDTLANRYTDMAPEEVR
ncbi:hypothetical protein [Celeribacter litoreus]|uniref:hypothetical protein n=1 Tax=Celeribacter litoreus TaxID=2876714 RepID=UPI001CC99FC7|nr:hypothetical protein [Celeribacter litoreus]MCA0044755.1 hypothetical protein [Celeribacter litoreus]